MALGVRMGRPNVGQPDDLNIVTTTGNRLVYSNVGMYYARYYKDYLLIPHRFNGKSIKRIRWSFIDTISTTSHTRLQIYYNKYNSILFSPGTTTLYRYSDLEGDVSFTESQFVIDWSEATYYECPRVDPLVGPSGTGCFINYLIVDFY